MIKFFRHIRQPQKSCPDYFDRWSLSLPNVLSTPPKGRTFANYELMKNVCVGTPFTVGERVGNKLGTL